MQFINKIPWLKNKYNSLLRNLMFKILFEDHYNLNADYILRKKSESIIFNDDYVVINKFSYLDVLIPKLILRRNSSDLLVFYQVFIEMGYKSLFDIFKKNFNPGDTPVSIVDLGANIGLTTMYATTQFDSCEIIAVEPFKDNFDILCNNIKNVSTGENEFKISALNKAVWKNTGRLKITDQTADGWAIQVVEDNNGEIESVTMEELLKSMPEVDILKIDIEGAEFVIINDLVDCDWLLKVKVIGIEIHKKFGNTTDLINKIISYGFSYCGCVGETTVFTRK